LPLIRCLRLALLALCIALPSVLVAQNADAPPRPTKAELVRFLAQVPEVVPIEADLRRLGFRGENLALAVAQTAGFYRDPVVAGYMAEQILNVYEGRPAPNLTDGLIWPMVERGLGHLPTRDLQSFYRVERALMAALPTHICAQTVRKRLSAQQFSDQITRAAARLYTPALREYYRIERTAARLGITRSPVRLSQAAMARVERRISAGLTLAIAQSDDPRGLLAAMEDIDRVSDKDACALGLLFYDVVLSQKGPPLREALLYIGLP
jgi:hypothetical protein